ncbi:MAG: hypothetical protein AAF547_06195 [Actinomycetota bacterium]
MSAVAEVPLNGDGVTDEGIVEIQTVGPAIEELLGMLGVEDRSRFRVGFTIGPRHAGVGSGPAMMGWLERQAVNLQENMQCAGGLGIAFVPCRAVDEALKLARDTGIELARIDLAPVAAARAVGAQIDDRMCVGSGHGWQSRMRDFEVLEAMECLEVADDAPLHLVGADGTARPIPGYGWVELAEDVAARGVDVGAAATAVGAAIGVAYDSPANLLAGKVVSCGTGESALAHNLSHLAAYTVSPDTAESTLRLNTPRPQVDVVAEARREQRDAPETSLAPIRRVAAPQSRSATQTIEPDVDIDVADGDVETNGQVSSADPINLFSPDTEVQHMMGTRDRRIAIDVVVGLIVLAAIAALIYLYVL